MEMAERVGWQKDDEVGMGKRTTKYIFNEVRKVQIKACA